jgi:hypothetical protein
MTMPNAPHTSKRVSEKAGELIRERKASEKLKSVAGSDPVQKKAKS